MKEKITYICEICGKEYDTKEEAIACESKKTTAPKYNVGEIVDTKHIVDCIKEIKTVGHDNIYVLNGGGEYKEEEILYVRMNKEQYEQLSHLSEIIKNSIYGFLKNQVKCQNIFVKASPQKSATIKIEAVCFF